VQGIVRVTTDVSEIFAKVATLRNRQVAIAATTLLAVSFGLLFFLRRTVVRPIQDLAACAEVLGRGQFDVCQPYTGPDEIGRLGQRFQDMAQSLSTAYKDLQAKNADLEKMVDDIMKFDDKAFEAFKRAMERTERIAKVASGGGPALEVGLKEEPAGAGPATLAGQLGRLW